MMSKAILTLALALLLTACAGKVSSIEYEYGAPTKAIEIYFVVAPAPAPVDARPPALQNLSVANRAYLVY